MNNDDYEGLAPSFAEACRVADDRVRSADVVKFIRPETDGRHVAPRFTLYRDLETTSTKSWLVHNLLGEGEASVMYGKPGDGKSVLAEDLGLHVAGDQPWHGRKTKQGAVVFVALERKKLVERRAIAFRKKYGLKDLPFAIVGGVYDFRQPSTVTALLEIIKDVEAATGQKVVLIVIDTISRALCGGDENSPKDMGAMVAATSRLQTNTTAHVLWVHHVPLDGSDRLRGHGALLGAVDTTISVTKGADGIRSGSVVKANDSDEGESVSFTLESVEIGQDEEGNKTAAPIVIPSATTERTQPRPSYSLPKAARTALRALAEAIDECGEPAPASNHIPQGVKVTTVDNWRHYAYRRGISPSEKPRARQAAFKRASEHLVGIEAAVIWDCKSASRTRFSPKRACKSASRTRFSPKRAHANRHMPSLAQLLVCPAKPTGNHG